MVVEWVSGFAICAEGMTAFTWNVRIHEIHATSEDLELSI